MTLLSVYGKPIKDLTNCVVVSVEEGKHLNTIHRKQIVKDTLNKEKYDKLRQRFPQSLWWNKEV